MSEKMSRRAVLSTTGRAAVATLSLGSLAVAGGTDPTADAALFLLQADLHAAIAAQEAAEKVSSAIHDQADAVAAPRPAGLPKPPEFTEQVNNMTFGEFQKLEEKSELRGAIDRYFKDNEAHLAKWKAEHDLVFNSFGYDAADVKFEECVDAVIMAAWRIIQAPAVTLTGVMVKLRLQDVEMGEVLECYVPDQRDLDYPNTLRDELLSSITADIRAMKAAA